MTTILSTQTAKFKFYDEFNPNNKSYYSVLINVNLLKYEDSKEFYDISYTYTLKHPKLEHPKLEHPNLETNKQTKTSCMKFHPFYENDEISDSAEGVIVHNNELSTMLIKYLLMPDDELSKFTNLTMAQNYRTNIMLSLAKFWD